jgi:hypothetical protein
MYLSNINIRHQLFVWIRVLIFACTAPDELLKTIYCRCKTNCDSKRCNCREHGLECMNVALPVEEAYIILTDEKQNGHLVLLDAKARFCFRRQTLHTFIFCECFIKWNNGSVRPTIWKQKIGDGLLNTTCACQ